MPMAHTLHNPHPIEFATATYGNTYCGMLFTFLHSISMACPRSRTRVFWQDIDERRVAALKIAYPHVEFIETEAPLASSSVERISQKVYLWEHAASTVTSPALCMLDCDMIVVRDPTKYFSLPFDVGFTVKNEKFPINTGTLLLRNSPAALKFLRVWREKTSDLLTQQDMIRLASSPDYPYGGVDQMAFHRLIDYSARKEYYCINIDQTQVTLKTLPCTELNETNSVPLNENQYILHYKGGWHSIILKGTAFTRNRRFSDCQEMHRLYISTYLSAVSHAEKRGINDVRHLFPIAIPSYLSATDMSVNVRKLIAFRTAQPIFDRLSGARTRLRRLLARKDAR